MFAVGCVWCGHAENSTFLMYMSAVHFFLLIFLEKKRITFHDVCFSKPLTFHNDFMFFLLLVAVSGTFSRLQALLDM